MIRYPIVFVMLLLASIAAVATGQDKEKNQKPEKYVVLMITGADESITYEVVSKDLERSFKKDLDKQYKNSLNSWKDRKKEASKNKEAFEESKPERFKVKVVLKDASEQEANAYKKEAIRAIEAAREEKAFSSTEKSEDPNVKFSVVQIIDESKSVTIELIADSDVKEMKKKLDDEYKQAVKDWESAKKEAKKGKNKFTDPKPAKPKMKVIRKGLTEDKAREALSEAQEDLKKRSSSVKKKNKR